MTDNNRLQKTFDAIVNFIQALSEVKKNNENITMFKDLVERMKENGSQKQIRTCVSDFMIFCDEYESEILKKKWNKIQDDDKIFFNTRKERIIQSFTFQSVNFFIRNQST